MPLVLTEDYSHPKWVDGGVIENIKTQMRYAIGHITKLFKEGTVIDALYKITHPQAREAIEKEDIPFHTSPRVVHDPSEPDDNIKDWMGMHVAIVDKPAYGVDKATFKGACYGSAEQCQVALKQAKQEDCGFCVKTALTKLAEGQEYFRDKEGVQLNFKNLSAASGITLTENADDIEIKLVTNSNSSLTSLETEAQNSQTSMGDIPTPQIDTSKFVSVDAYNALKQEVDVFKTAANEAKATYQKEIEALKEERRAEKITAIVDAKISDKAKAVETIKKFVDAKVTPEIVADAMALIPETKRSNEEIFAGKVQDASSQNRADARPYLNSIVRGIEL